MGNKLKQKENCSKQNNLVDSKEIFLLLLFRMEKLGNPPCHGYLKSEISVLLEGFGGFTASPACAY